MTRERNDLVMTRERINLVMTRERINLVMTRERINLVMTRERNDLVMTRRRWVPAKTQPLPVVKSQWIVHSLPFSYSVAALLVLKQVN
jgi:hypothetical protein